LGESFVLAIQGARRSADGTPSFFTVLKLFKARGLRVHFQSVAV